MVGTHALRSRVPRFKTRSDHSLNLFPVVPGSTSRPHFSIANWLLFASSHLGFLAVVVFCRYVDCVSLALKSPYGEWSIKDVLLVLYLGNSRDLFVENNTFHG